MSDRSCFLESVNEVIGRAADKFVELTPAVYPVSIPVLSVLQHARMYGYRRKDIGLLRLFLPNELHVVFQAINKMERGLRELIAKKPNEEFRGIYVESGLSATRKNILAPGSIGVYSGGSNYNPAQVLRDGSVKSLTDKIDRKLARVPDKTAVEMTIDDIRELIGWTRPDPKKSQHVWNSVAATESLVQFANRTDTTVVPRGTGIWTGLICFVINDQAREASNSATFKIFN